MEKDDKSLPRASSLRSGRALSRPEHLRRAHRRHFRAFTVKCFSCRKESEIRAQRKPKFCPACGAKTLDVQPARSDRQFLNTLKTLAIIDLGSKLLTAFAPRILYEAGTKQLAPSEIAAPPERSEEARRQQPKKTDIQ